ncbi:hypothetical protein [Luteipulveratus halotolerans]|uniref:hypothetical protein n=1 Tax=Luteipulveratus halotolerans TaxID=1631356 RepID=UPI0012F82340|nr:hypothetical protein [Luteipulveratus halotolerans]
MRSTARGYGRAIESGNVQGNGGYAQVGEFLCSTAVLDDRPMSDAYQICHGKGRSFRIGD